MEEVSSNPTSPISFQTTNVTNYYEIFNPENNLILNSKIEEIVRVLKDKDNSDKYVVDLGGGYGYYGLLIKNLIGAKKTICFEPDINMINSGKIKYQNSLDSIEYVNDRMEKFLERSQDEKFCVILAKETIHFTNPEFFDKLMNLCNNQLNGLLIVAGFANYNFWKYQAPIPEHTINKLKNYERFTVHTCFDLANEKQIKHGYPNKIDLSFSDQPYELTFEQYERFIMKCSWSYFLEVSKEVLEETVRKYKDLSIEKKSSTVNLTITFAFLSIQFS